VENDEQHFGHGWQRYLRKILLKKALLVLDSWTAQRDTQFLNQCLPNDDVVLKK